MHPFSSKLRSHPGCRSTLNRVPCAVRRSPLVIHFTHSRVHLSTSTSPATRGCHFDGFTFLSIRRCLSLGDFPQLFKVPGCMYIRRLLTWSFNLSQEHFVVAAILLLSPPASDSFPVSRLFASGGQMIGAPASASVLPMNIQD